MTPRICISGSGVVSSIGIGKQETLQALLDGRRGLAAPQYLQTVHSQLPVGEVPLSDSQLKSLLDLPGDRTVPRTSLLAMLAVREALAEASGVERFHPALLSGTTVGGMDITERQPFDGQLDGQWDCGRSTDVIADYFGCFSAVFTPSTACSSAANAILLGARLIQAGIHDVVVAGGAECLTRFHLNGFKSLMITDGQFCRPFDATREGLNLGEGAGYLVLESEAHARARGARILAYLDGWGNACDAFHQTASSPEGDGAFEAMRQALERAGLQPVDIGYVNAHGTGTPNNDASESQALKRLFGEQLPPISSTKGQTGHTTSASGGIEAVFCLQALQEGFVPGNAGFATPFEGGILPQRTSVSAPGLRHVLCNAFGFGGNDSSLLISKAI